ncbi:hypothetical protein [Desertivirga xinjiangensis]|uniref:hypothetical protein n=1 Tax=Desertivirga xinjiangensis TaxID=539206 RepID=UPI00210CA3FF|nr:hypothetical protein [Pedobacter xinjiangensis]
MNIDEFIEAEAKRGHSAWFHKDEVKTLVRTIIKELATINTNKDGKRITSTSGGKKDD